MPLNVRVTRREENNLTEQIIRTESIRPQRTVAVNARRPARSSRRPITRGRLGMQRHRWVLRYHLSG
jgi:hypothetical protein